MDQLCPLRIHTSAQSFRELPPNLSCQVLPHVHLHGCLQGFLHNCLQDILHNCCQGTLLDCWIHNLHCCFESNYCSHNLDFHFFCNQLVHFHTPRPILRYHTAPPVELLPAAYSAYWLPSSFAGTIPSWRPSCRSWRRSAQDLCPGCSSSPACPSASRSHLLLRQNPLLHPYLPPYWTSCPSGQPCRPYQHQPSLTACLPSSLACFRYCHHIGCHHVEPSRPASAASSSPPPAALSSSPAPLRWITPMSTSLSTGSSSSNSM